MKKLILILLAVALSAPAFAQWNFGYKLGMNISSISNYREADGYDNVPKTGFAGGLTVEYRFSDLFGLESGLIYSRQGVSQVNDNPDGFVYWDPTLDFEATKIKAKLRINYLNAPLKMSFRFGKFGISAGGQAGLLLNAQSVTKQKYDVPTTQPYVKQGTDKNRLNLDNSLYPDFDYGVLGGVSYAMARNTVLSLEYYNGLRNINKVSNLGGTDKDQYNRMITLSIGSKF